MNRERILRLADVIENGMPSIHFDMRVWAIVYDSFDEEEREELRVPGHCSMVACIGGHAELLWVKDDDFAIADISIHDVAELLDIDFARSAALCAPSGVSWSGITRADAALTLRKLAETGEVDWSHVTERLS